MAGFRSLVRVSGVVAVLGSLLGCPRAAAEELKVAFVNMVILFDQYERTKQADAVLEQKGEEKEQELEGRLNELKRLREGLELLRNESLEAKRREVEAKADALKRFRANALRDLQGERESVAEAIFEDIRKAVEEYATSNGLTLVMDQRSVLYGQPGRDATDEVLELLNSRYRQRR